MQSLAVFIGWIYHSRMAVLKENNWRHKKLRTVLEIYGWILKEESKRKFQNIRKNVSGLETCGDFGKTMVGLIVPFSKCLQMLQLLYR